MIYITSMLIKNPVSSTVVMTTLGWYCLQIMCTRVISKIPYLTKCMYVRLHLEFWMSASIRKFLSLLTLPFAELDKSIIVILH